MEKPANQDLPKKERTRLKSKFAKEESIKNTKQELENFNHLKDRRKRKRTNSKLNDENIP